MLLPTSIFFLKFLEWWYASDFARQLSTKTAASIELPPPVGLKPPPPSSERNRAHGSSSSSNSSNSRHLVRAPKDDSGRCPICEREIANPTAVQTGYVFCYPCVFRWVQDGQGRTGDDVGEEGKQARVGRCPVTGVRLLGGTEGLRRLMI